MGALKNKLSVLPIAVVMVLSVSACNGNGENPPPANPTGDQGGTERDAQAAIEAAVAAVPGSSAVELDYSNRHQSWEVELIDVDTGHEVEVSPDGSEVLDQHTTGSADPEDAGDLKQANVSLVEAIDTALEAEGDVVDEVSLGSEDGLPVWEIETQQTDGSGTEVLIDGMTGERIG